MVENKLTISTEQARKNLEDFRKDLHKRAWKRVSEMKEMEKKRLNDILYFARKGEIFCRKISEDNRNPDLLKEYYRGKAKAFREILEFIDEEGLSGPITQIKATDNGNSIDNSNRGDSIDVVFAAIGQ